MSKTKEDNWENILNKKKIEFVFEYKYNNKYNNINKLIKTTLTMNQSILYPEDIIKAHKIHGDNFIIIDFTTIKENQAKTVKYCQLKIKKENGHEVVPIIKLINLFI